tara:strand:- start:8169 stop:9356 length:1188 start_codon:yes stop_codon:yes gene_type:complete
MQEPVLIKCQYPGFVGNPHEFISDSISNSWGELRSNYQTLCENKLKEITGRKYALVLSHGTSALITLIKSLKLPPCTLIGVPSLSWISCASSIIHAGHIPVFLDIDDNDCVLGSKAISQISKYRIKHVMTVNLFGRKVKDIFLRFCLDSNITIIEDATHSPSWDNFLSVSKGIPLVPGKIGVGSCFSFQATKTITAGQGGALVTDSEEIYRNALSFSRHGMNLSPGGKFYWSNQLGDNFPPSDFQCSILYSQLLALKDITAFRKSILDEYLVKLSSMQICDFDIFPDFQPQDSIYLPLVRLINTSSSESSDFVEKVIEIGGGNSWNIEIRPTSYPLHLMPTFSSYYNQFPLDLSNSERLSSSTFILPFGNNFPVGFQQEVLTRINDLISFVKQNF